MSYEYRVVITLWDEFSSRYLAYDGGYKPEVESGYGGEPTYYTSKKEAIAEAREVLSLDRDEEKARREYWETNQARLQESWEEFRALEGSSKEVTIERRPRVGWAEVEKWSV